MQQLDSRESNNNTEI